MKIKFLDDLNERLNDPLMEVPLERCRLNSLSFSIISQNFHEPLNWTITANGSIYRIFKPNNCRIVRNFYQDKASMNITLKEFKCLTSSCWVEKYQPLTIEMTKHKYTGRYSLELKSLFVPNTNHF